jgi:23S rRNA pseudoU1915 N3-methylase RlmH
MQITIYTIGKIKNTEFQSLFDYYFDLASKKANRIKFELRQLPDRNPESKVSIETLLADTNVSSQQALFLAEWGREYDTPGFISLLDGFYQNDRDVSLFIANAWGWEVADRTKYRFISLSQLTFNHELAIVMLSEQLFRFADKLAGGSYHK